MMPTSNHTIGGITDEVVVPVTGIGEFHGVIETTEGYFTELYLPKVLFAPGIADDIISEGLLCDTVGCEWIGHKEYGNYYLQHKSRVDNTGMPICVKVFKEDRLPMVRILHRSQVKEEQVMVGVESLRSRSSKEVANKEAKTSLQSGMEVYVRGSYFSVRDGKCPAVESCVGESGIVTTPGPYIGMTMYEVEFATVLR
jgi:hypothetical protein